MDTELKPYELRCVGNDLVCDLGLVSSIPETVDGVIDYANGADLQLFSVSFAERAREATEWWRGAQYTVENSTVTIRDAAGMNPVRLELLPARWWDSPETAVDIYLARRLR